MSNLSSPNTYSELLMAAVVAAAVAAATEGIWAKRFMNDIVETSHIIDARSANSTLSGIRSGGIG